MIKFELETVDNNYAKFKAEYDPTPESDRYTNQTFFFHMQQNRWRQSNRPTELLISIEGYTA